MPAGSTYTPIATQTLGSAAASVTFSSIPSTYTDLILIANYGDTETSTDTRCLIQVGNGSVDTGSNYSTTATTGDGTSATSTRNSSRTFFDNYTGGSRNTSGYFAINIYQFLNYSNTTTNKTVLYRQNTTDPTIFTGTSAVVGLWRSTSAINIIKILPRTGGINILTGASFTLYGIAAA
jgi:hypothetical protein